ncbi:MAG TPA: peptidylprolyl isomerase [Saprospiraceae bacterium]|nr:peptidylprolyl isomerase [Saprospiraceae bacterium]
MKVAKTLGLILLTVAFVNAQKSDPVLFTVAGNPVHLSEFEYIYNKNNGKDADYTRKSLEDYLALYTKFKLKVQAARDKKLDTIPSLIKELEGYRQQLTTNYLNDKEVTDRLAREVYERQKKDLLISHILFNLSPNATGADTVKSYEMAMNAYKSLKSGAKFAESARSLSNDLSSAGKGGRLGWFTSMLPDGFYMLENVAYSLKKGEYSLPFRTKLGYHILLLEDERPARRKMEGAHILVKKAKKGMPDGAARLKIDSLYYLIKNGASFEELARQSDDKTSNSLGGNIGFFGINQFESTFEDAAFGLNKDGDISTPVETSIGWHLIKRLKREEELPYERAKRKIQNDITRDSRFGSAQSTLIEKIKLESNYKEKANAISNFSAQMDTNFFTYKWKVPENLAKEEMASIGNISLGSDQFAEFVRSNTRQRLLGADNKDIKATIRTLFNEFVAQRCLQFEEGKLEDKYPDFKSLMREYREGILLFEATKNEVWDKASEDTTGLKLFYEKNKNNYKWEQRATVHEITVDTSNKKLAEKIYKYCSKKGIDKTIAKFDPNKTFISYQRTIAEAKNQDALNGLNFVKGSMTELKPITPTQYSFKKVEDILPAGNKTLDEARGYIIADYQDYLEGLWVDELRGKYKVNVNDEVLNSLIKK